MSQRVRALNSRLTSAQKLIDEANHELLYLGDTKVVVGNKDEDSKLSSILNNVSQIRNELRNLKEIVSRVDMPLSTSTY